MKKKEINTSELENIFKKTKIEEIDDVFEEQEKNMINEQSTKFYMYMREKWKEKGLKEKDVIYCADIDQKYGYKILNSGKLTAHRDLIIRICFASQFNLDETQKALKLYGVSVLYSRVPRDAVMIVLFNDRPKDILEFNKILMQKGYEPLKASGIGKKQ